MALDTNDDLDLFFEDDGIDVSLDAGATFLRALTEQYDEKVNEGRMGNASIGRLKALTMKAVETEAVAMGAIIHIGGTPYKVRDIMLIQDGKFRHFLLKEQVVV